MPQGRYLAAFVLAIGLLLIFISLRRQSRSPNAYRISDLLLGDDGRASKSAHVLFGSFFITSWVVVWAALSGKLSDTEFAAYLAAWVAPAVTVLLTKSSASAPDEGKVTATKVTVDKATAVTAARRPGRQRGS